MTGNSFDLKDLERRMIGAISVLKTEFGGLRTGRASASLLDPNYSGCLWHAHAA